MDSNNHTKGYFKRVVHYQDDSLRIDTIYRYNKDKTEANKFVDKFLIEDDIYKSLNREDYFNVKYLDSCFDYTNRNYENFKSCYKGKKEISTNKLTEVHHFLITQTESDGVSKNKYLDENFILIREEYIDGYAPYYKIDRIESIEGID